MKKLLVIALVLSMVFALAACGGGKAVEVDTAALGTAIANGNLFVDKLAKINNSVVDTIIGADTSLCSSVEYYIGSGNTGEEYGIFVCNTEKDARTIEEQLTARKVSLHDLYESYAPDAIVRIDNAVIKQSGIYVVFVSADDYASASTIANDAFKG